MALSPNSSTLLFAHPSARLTKTVPPVHPPIRANGAVPLDALGLGNPASQRDVLLADTYGPLALNVVPHPFLPLPASLVLSIGSAPDAQAAARTHVLPFRAIHTRSSSSQAATPRTTYDGLGAGLHGTEGGSFWFFEHVDEEGAADRARWEHQGVGRRAIWTVWLLR